MPKQIKNRQEESLFSDSQHQRLLVELQSCKNVLLKKLETLKEVGVLKHSVAQHNGKEKETFELLEFYGDSYLYHAISKMLAQTKRFMSPHLLTQIRISTVSNQTLARVFDSLGLNTLIKSDDLGTKITTKQKGDIVESIIGELAEAFHNPSGLKLFSIIEKSRETLDELISFILYTGETIFNSSIIYKQLEHDEQKFDYSQQHRLGGKYGHDDQHHNDYSHEHENGGRKETKSEVCLTTLLVNAMEEVQQKHHQVQIPPQVTIMNQKFVPTSSKQHHTVYPQGTECTPKLVVEVDQQSDDLLLEKKTPPQQKKTPLQQKKTPPQPKKLQKQQNTPPYQGQQAPGEKEQQPVDMKVVGKSRPPALLLPTNELVPQIEHDTAAQVQKILQLELMPFPHNQKKKCAEVTIPAQNPDSPTKSGKLLSPIAFQTNFT